VHLVGVLEETANIRNTRNGIHSRMNYNNLATVFRTEVISAGLGVLV